MYSLKSMDYISEEVESTNSFVPILGVSATVYHPFHAALTLKRKDTLSWKELYTK